MQIFPFGAGLTQGQLIWVICHGKFPSEEQTRQLVAEIRYLRALGVPFEEKKRGKGQGNPLAYDFFEAMEVCIAIAALRRGMRPKEVAAYFEKHREDVRALCREILESLPEAAVTGYDYRPGERSVSLRGDERFLRLHDRYSEQPGKYDVIGLDEAKELEDFMGTKEVFSDGAVRHLIPLTRLVLEVAALAKKAPAVRPGPK